MRYVYAYSMRFLSGRRVFQTPKTNADLILTAVLYYWLPRPYDMQISMKLIRVRE